LHLCLIGKLYFPIGLKRPGFAAWSFIFVKHKGYSLAFSAETPTNAGFSKEISGIRFFVEDNDVWFFDDTKTYLSVDEYLDELQVTFKEENSNVLN
jgi:uncharacterized protein YneR